MKLMCVGILFLCLALVLIIIGSREVNRSVAQLTSSSVYIGENSGFVNETGDYLKTKGKHEPCITFKNSTMNSPFIPEKKNKRRKIKKQK